MPIYMYQMKKTKCDDESEKFIFIGYETNSKGYKLYNLNNEKIITCSDVVFNRERTWEWKILYEE